MSLPPLPSLLSELVTLLAADETPRALDEVVEPPLAELSAWH
jgi:hypothetical protein